MELYLLAIVMLTPSISTPGITLQITVHSEYVAASQPSACAELALKRLEEVRAKMRPAQPHRLVPSCQAITMQASTKELS